MFLTRVIGRRFLAAARSETSSATAAASTTTMGYNPLEEFFEADRSPNDDKPVVYGRSWKASELRLKSWDDLNKLWYVLLKEKNMLMTQRQMLNAQNLRFPNPERIPKVRKSMCRIKQVLTERAIDEPDPRRSAEMKRMVTGGGGGGGGGQSFTGWVTQSSPEEKIPETETRTAQSTPNCPVSVLYQVTKLKGGSKSLIISLRVVGSGLQFDHSLLNKG
ncbi:39S ribosomal protein L47, mitochondrial, partial [Cucurbita argyrosperma subsp. sororia]